MHPDYWFFVTYQYASVVFNAILENQHPIDWIAELRNKYPGSPPTTHKLLFYQEIDEDLAKRNIRHFGE